MKGDLPKNVKICFDSMAMTIVENGKHLRWVQGFDPSQDIIFESTKPKNGGRNPNKAVGNLLKGVLSKYLINCFESMAMTIVANGKQLRWVQGFDPSQDIIFESTKAKN